MAAEIRPYQRTEGPLEEPASDQQREPRSSI